jgi:hypothetical protein
LPLPKALNATLPPMFWKMFLVGSTTLLAITILLFPPMFVALLSTPDAMMLALRPCNRAFADRVGEAEGAGRTGCGVLAGGKGAVEQSRGSRYRSVADSDGEAGGAKHLEVSELPIPKGASPNHRNLSTWL